MEHYLHRVQLPEHSLTCVIVGERYRQRLEAPLISRNISVLWMPDNPNVDPRLAGHTDLSMFPLHANRLLLADFLKEHSCFVNCLTNKGVSVVFSQEVQTPIYPHDTGCNACHFGNTLIWNPKTADPIIANELSDHGQVPVRQGYTNCTVVPIDEGSIITDDAGIAKAAAHAGLDVLQIRSGFIELPGFETGFLGGASCMYAHDTILFTGSLQNHPDADKIFKFLEKYHIKPDFLTSLPIFDIGSILGILEE